MGHNHMVTRVPFNQPSLTGSEIGFIEQAVEAMHLSGNGSFTRQCETRLEAMLGAPRVLLTTSCTHALEMAALLLDVSAADEVIVPSFTFVSTASAFALRGARLVFADVRPDTLNLDEGKLEALITDRTKAIVVVHYAGVACEMDAIVSIASRHGVAVVEDNAHGLLGRYRGKCLGTFGALATQSFHETKNVTCGEGGALVVNDVKYAARAEIIREKGTDRSRFLRGEVQKYTWIDHGSSYVLSEILAAFLYAQLLAIDGIQAKRKEIWHKYQDGLAGWASRTGVRLPVVPPGVEQSYHMFYLIMPSPDERTGLIAHLDTAGVSAVSHYVPLHLSEMGRRFGGDAGSCPVTERVSECLLRLPFHNRLTGDDVDRVLGAVIESEMVV
jgi:dTDP-4-amino-4,6-dideoxygalactose transaminase